MKVVQGMRDIVDDYELFLLDMWGVMHDGNRPYEGVLEVVQKLKEAGKRLVILSNSSKRQDNSLNMLRKLGFDPDDFEQVITSGEVAFKMLGGESPLPTVQPWSALKDVPPKAIVLGSGDGDEAYLEGCGWHVSSIEEASLVVARGTFTVQDDTSLVQKREDATAYDTALASMLEACATRRIPMLVCNPDKVRPDIARPPMPGKIGDAYEAALARQGDVENPAALVKRIGKPFADVYDLALRKGVDDPSRACMVGDALETDVTGGTLAGIDTVWVLMDGIHTPDLEGGSMDGAALVLEKFSQQLNTYANGLALQPNLLMAHFRW
jgi:HAD superfamily hydrolase (TIGR01459 family)